MVQEEPEAAAYYNAFKQKKEQIKANQTAKKHVNAGGLKTKRVSQWL
jgi:hypothetical protein